MKLMVILLLFLLLLLLLLVRQKRSLKLGKWTGRVRNRRASRDHSNYSIGKSDENTEKSPGDLRRLAIIHTPVRGNHLKLV